VNKADKPRLDIESKKSKPRPQTKGKRGLIAKLIIIAGLLASFVMMLSLFLNPPAYDNRSVDNNSNDGQVVDIQSDDIGNTSTEQPAEPTDNTNSASGTSEYDRIVRDNAKADAAAKAELERIKAENDAASKKAQDELNQKRAADEAQRIAGLRSQYKSQWNNALVQEQATRNRILSQCQSEASSKGLGYGNYANNCLSSRYGNYDQKVAAINAEYQALCNSVGGC
jgi:hypothetical protein